MCASILAELPEWFGLADVNASYATRAEGPDTWVAEDGISNVGVMILKRHGRHAIENVLLAVRRSHHGQGIGRRLLTSARDFAIAEGAQYVTVKTLGYSADYEPYVRTRAFYRRAGFIPLEEFADWWGAANPCLFMVLAVGTAGANPG